MNDNELAAARSKIEEQAILLEDWVKERKRLQGVIDHLPSNAFFTTIDYGLLAEQKLTLLDTITTLAPIAPTTVEHLDGIVHLIDALQDTAERLGLPVVFLTEADDE